MTEEQKKQEKDPAIVQMEQDQAAELASLQQANQQRYTDVGQIVAEAESKLGTLKQQDAVAQKRSNAFRYIAGLGDTLSGIANVVGTAYGAQNQKQTYNGGYVAEKAERARKERKLEMDKISTRLDEMRAREKDLKAAGSLAEAELKAKQNRELAAEKSRLDSQAREEAWRQKQQAWKEEEAARAQANADRMFKEEQRQFNATNQRLADAADAENESREAIEKMKIAAKAQQDANDPKNQAKVLQQNITGIRDELAREMGYDDYNEYLIGQNWKKNTIKRNQPNDIYEDRIKRFPEAQDLLDKLSNPENLTEEEVRMLMSASSVFADAVNRGADGSAEEDEFNQFIRR